jgi:nucleoside-diphosphate kinase
MSSRPVIVAVLTGDNVIARVRELLGPTNSKLAPKGTIRGDYGTEMMRNVCHASDSPAAAEAEIRRFFRSDEVRAPQASRV